MIYTHTINDHPDKLNFDQLRITRVSEFFVEIFIPVRITKRNDCCANTKGQENSDGKLQLQGHPTNAALGHAWIYFEIR